MQELLVMKGLYMQRKNIVTESNADGTDRYKSSIKTAWLELGFQAQFKFSKPYGL